MEKAVETRIHEFYGEDCSVDWVSLVSVPLTVTLSNCVDFLCWKNDACWVGEMFFIFFFLFFFQWL